MLSNFSKGSSIYIAGIVPILFPARHRTWVTAIGEENFERIPRPDKVIVEAGQQVVRLKYRRDRDAQFCGGLGGCFDYEHKEELVVEFYAQAGREYRLYAYIPGDTEWAWVEEEPTGEVVAGKRPPDLDL